MRTAGQVWARAGLMLGIAASLAGNVKHTYLPKSLNAVGTAGTVGTADMAGQIVASVFWPVALFVTIEIILKTKWRPGWRDMLVRVAGVGSVGAVAAYVSYGHLSGLLLSYGYDTVSAHAGPIAVDGMMIAATVALSRHAAASEQDSAPEIPAPEVQVEKPAALPKDSQVQHETTKEVVPQEVSPTRVELARVEPIKVEPVETTRKRVTALSTSASRQLSKSIRGGDAP